MHELLPGQMGKVQLVQSGSSPINTSAKLDLPTPAAPIITIVGLGRSSVLIFDISKNNNAKTAMWGFKNILDPQKSRVIFIANLLSKLGQFLYAKSEQTML